jgi:hypothetical protein
VFVVVYVGVGQREREARQRTEALSAEVAQLAAANERNLSFVEGPDPSTAAESCALVRPSAPRLSGGLVGLLQS